MALGDSFATLSELKGRLSIDDTVDDTALTNTLAASTHAIIKHCGRDFNDAGSATARLYEATNGCTLYVDDFISLTSIKTDADGDGVYETTWSSSDYQLYPLNGISEGETGWPYSRIESVLSNYLPVWPTYYGRRPFVQVTARWGWSAVPAPVKEACLVAAHEVFKLRDAGGIVPTVRIGKNPYVASLLMPYQRYPVKVG